jgi:hypothetical protein
MPKTLEHLTYYRPHYSYFSPSKELREAQGKFLDLSPEERRIQIDKDHEIARASNLYVDHAVELFETMIGYSRRQIFKEGLLSKTKIAEERIKTREELQRFEEENPKYSEIIDEAQRVLETINPEYRKDFNIRDYLEIVESDEEYEKRMRDGENIWASCDLTKKRMVVNAHPGKKGDFVPLKSDELYSEIDFLQSLLHESLHLMSFIPHKKTLNKIIEKTGFGVVHLDPDNFKTTLDKNRNLNEHATYFLTVELLLRSKYAEQIDRREMREKPNYSGYFAMGFITKLIGIENFVRCYFSADYDSLYSSVRKASRKKKNNETHTLRKVWNVLSQDKI